MANRDAQGRFIPGNSVAKTGGRPAGALNKTNQEIRNIIVEAFEQLGGVDALVAWGRENPGEFYKGIWRPLLPATVKMDVQTNDFVSILESARQRVSNKSLVIEHQDTGKVPEESRLG